jgi:uncharacterized membrane protein YbhN (UPF0104 family)
MTATLTKPALARRIAVAAGMMAATVSVVLAVPPLRGAGHQIAHMRPVWVGVALALEIASCAGFAVIFRLFFDRLPAGLARELAWVETGCGALLRGGGVGGLAIGGWLLHDAGISQGSIVRRSSGLFFMTSAASVAAMVGAGVLVVCGALPGPGDLALTLGPVLVGVGAVLAVLAMPLVWRRSRGRAPQSGLPGQLVEGVTVAAWAFARPSWRLLGAAGYLGLDITALAATFAATGHPLPFAPLVLGYTIGYLGNLVPVPGGFGALEGGLAAALVAYGAPVSETAAAVIVYHAIAFWVPSIGGAVAYWLMRRRLGAVAPLGAGEADRPTCPSPDLCTAQEGRRHVTRPPRVSTRTSAELVLEGVDPRRTGGAGGGYTSHHQGWETVRKLVAGPPARGARPRVARRAGHHLAQQSRLLRSPRARAGDLFCALSYVKVSGSTSPADRASSTSTASCRRSGSARARPRPPDVMDAEAPATVGASLLFTSGRGHSSVGRAPALQAGGRRFDPGWLHLKSPGNRSLPGM